MTSWEKVMRYTTCLAIAMFSSACIPELYSSGGDQGPWVAPENSWPISEPPAELVGVGYQEGHVAPDVRLLDQFGAEVSLWQFYGDVILIDISTMWCAPCQTVASHTQETYEDYVDEGFVYLTILHENVNNEPPSNDDLNLWADTFGIAAPVLGDGDQVTGSAVTQGQYPAVFIIDRTMNVSERLKSNGDDDIRKAIDRAL